MPINGRAATDAAYALTGKDGAFYTLGGTMIATCETFAANVTVTNAKYNALGDAQEHETLVSYGIVLTMSQIVVEDDDFIEEFIEGLQTGVMPRWNFKGVLQGRDGDVEQIIYRDCIPSGEIGIQNIVVGEPIKRNWSFFVNEPPELDSQLTRRSPKYKK